MNVLIIEDEKNLAYALKDMIESHKGQAVVCLDGQDGYDTALMDGFDVIILDVMLPSMNGYEIIAHLRKEGKETPVLMLSALDEVDRKIEGLNKGADDYMTKPFSLKELWARLEVLTRRKGQVVVSKLSYGDLVLDLSLADLSCHDKSIHLSFKEFEIMKLLMSNENQVIAKETILTRVWGLETDMTENNVEAYISFLRKKLVFLKSSVSIKVIRKLGYVLEARP